MKVIKTGLTLLLLVITAYSVSASDYDYNKLIGHNWYGIYMKNSKIGYASIELSEDSQNRMVLNLEILLSFMVNQVQTNMSMSDYRIYAGDKLELVHNKFTNKSGIAEISVIGELSNDLYNITIDIAGQNSSMQLNSPVELLGDRIKVEMMASSGKLKAGDEFEFTTFEPEPPMIKNMQHIIKVEKRKKLIFNGVVTEVFEVKDSLAQLGINSYAVVDINGNTLKMELASVGFVMKLEPEDLAKKLDFSFDILSDNIIHAPNGPENPRNVKHAKYIISGYDIASFPESEFIKVKSFSSDSAEITINSPANKKFSLNRPITQTELEQHLKSEPLIQSNNQKVIDLAKEIVKDEKNAFNAAVLINDWVFKNIRKEFSPDISNALQTLQLGRGDCGEHAALAVALMRASGIPSRITSGLAYWPEGEGFAFHAWIEAYVGEWVQMDPSWGETIADATHIMLSRDNSEEQIGAVFRAMDGLKIAFVSYD